MSDSSTVPHAAVASGKGLSHKVGPLPIYGWLVIIVGSYFLFKYLKGKSASSTGAATSSGDGTVSASDNAATPSNLGAEGFSVNSAGQVTDVGSGDVLGYVSGSTNSTGTVQSWLAAAQSALTGLGYNTNNVNSALAGYSQGNALTPAEYGIVEAATKIIGAAPGLGTPVAGAPVSQYQNSYGYGGPTAPTESDANGNVFSYIASWAEAQSLSGNGVPLYYIYGNDSQGNPLFAQATNSNGGLVSALSGSVNTPLYQLNQTGTAGTLPTTPSGNTTPAAAQSSVKLAA